MLILDRYLLRQFVQVFMICFCSLTGLYIVIDGFNNLDEFIEYSKKAGSLLQVLGQYYSVRSLSFFDMTSSLLTLIAAMFTVTWIQRHNELTAIESAGISKSRIIKPIIAGVAAVSLISAALRELAIPLARAQLSHNAQDLGRSAGKILQPRYDNRTDILIHGAQTFADKQRILKPAFHLQPPLDVWGKQLTAQEAFYQPPQEGRPGGYLFKKIEQPKGLDDQPSLTLQGAPVIITPHDAKWLQSGECFVVSDVTFEQLEGAATWRQFSSTAELVRGLRNRSLDFGADVRVDIHMRIVQPVLDMTLLFLGLPWVLVRGNRNMFAAIGLCLGVVIVFKLVILGCQFMGASSFLLSPALAAWLPVMIFVPCAAALAQPMFE